MTEAREQLEALISRSTDDDFSAAERVQIERALSDRPELDRTRAEYERLGGLLAVWRDVPMSVEWSSFHRSVSSAVRERDEAVADDAGLSSVDRVVRRMAGPMPQVDWSAFKARISSAVRAEATKSGAPASVGYRLPAGVRWLAPLAAAAVIAISIFRSQSPISAPFETDESRPTMVLVSLDVPQSRGQISFSFDETERETGDTESLPGTAFVTTGPRTVSGFEEPF
ncbi:MAG TPA: hypothetical protein VNT79_18650 [Phycisphaerae bacterium]|nr:hypothetical protein [Phycisphaerae bacterium]